MIKDKRNGASSRIKKLIYRKQKGDYPIEHDDGVFLLKAFLVMWEIADLAQRKGSEIDIGKIFEESMSE